MIMNFDGFRTGLSVAFRALSGLNIYTAKRLSNIPTSWSNRICILTICLLGVINMNTFEAKDQRVELLQRKMINANLLQLHT